MSLGRVPNTLRGVLETVELVCGLLRVWSVFCCGLPLPGADVCVCVWYGVVQERAAIAKEFLEAVYTLPSFPNGESYETQRQLRTWLATSLNSSLQKQGSTMANK